MIHAFIIEVNMSITFGKELVLATIYMTCDCYV
jgi:hypothetical protein